MQDRAFVNRHCVGFPGAEVSQPFGPAHDCWKVGGRMFAIIGQIGDGVTVKTDHVETARLLIETGRADPGGPAEEGAGRAGIGAPCPLAAALLNCPGG